MTPEACAAMGQTMGGMMGQMLSGGMMSGGMMATGWTWGGLWFGLLTMAAILAIGLAIVLVLARRTTGPAAEDPREILRRRFARGELNAEEFGDAMKALG